MTTSQTDTTATEQYIHDIVRRSRVPMPPFDHETNWSDKPRTHKVYPGTVTIALDAQEPADDLSVGDLIAGADAGKVKRFTLESLGSMLWWSYGVHSRKLVIHRNDDVVFQHSYAQAIWARTSASGGSLYAIEAYFVTSGEGGLLAGIYSWDPVRHELQRLGAGNVVGRVQEALGEHERRGSYLLLTVKEWKNSFKYNSFTPHVTSTDIGTLCSTMHLWAANQGMDVAPRLWFEESVLDDVLGLDPLKESVVAAIPLDFGDEWSAGQQRGPLQHHEAERSRTLLRFERNEEVFTEMREDTSLPKAPLVELPPLDRPASAVARVELPEPEPIPASLGRAVLERHSSFGMFSSRQPMTMAELHALLRAAVAANDGVGFSDLPSRELVGAWVLVNHVEGLRPGAYHYDPDSRTLELMVDADLTTFEQRTYYLKNYNFEQASAVITITGWPVRAIRAHGPRALRMSGMAVGAACQYVYLAAAGLGLGCGAALGFENVAYGELFGIAHVDSEDAVTEWPQLILAVGREDGVLARLDCPVAPKELS